jgi:hypothetical protein
MHRNSSSFMFLLCAVLTPLALAQPTYASKEGGLSLYTVKLDSPGMDDSGPVHVEMKRSDKGIETLKVSAFGKTETAPSALLGSIKQKRWLNGVLLSWERGYPDMGGKTIYLSLTEGGTAGAVVVAVIGFSEHGKFEVFGNLSNEEVAKKAARVME